MRHSDDFLLISKVAVERIERLSPGFRQFLSRFLVPGGPVRRFPNGAIEIHQVGVGGPEEHPLLPYAAAGCEMEGRGTFRTLGPFMPKRFYCIQYPLDYQERLKSEASFRAGLGARTPPVPGEFDLAELRVAVCFRTRVGKDVRHSFVDFITAWGRAAAEHGAFDDGPARLVSPGVTFLGTRAQFRIDVSRSGQDTLNWLSLAILDFGSDFQPVTEVTFGYSEAELDELTGPVKGEPVRVAFSSRQLLGAPPEEDSPSASYVPSAAQPASPFRSKHFRVLTLPVDEWDRFVVTIYFGRALTADERQNLEELVRAWRVLSFYGGFGGRGAHSADEIAFDEATDSAMVKSDMGDTKAAIAVPVLIRSLEGFQSGVGTPIDAIVLGALQ
jgi:hypothetical protein